MTRGRPPVALHRLILLLSIFINDCRFAASRHGTTRMELVHRHAAFPEIPAPTGLERVRDLVRRDGVRARAISRHGRRPRRQAWESPARADADVSGEMPMNSAADYGVGEYLVSIRVGRPAQKLMLFADTGSDLTWTRCDLPCAAADPSCGGKMALRSQPLRRRTRAFRAGLSSSFQPVPCSSRFCQEELVDLSSLPTCPAPSASCAYSYSYFDGTSTKGIFANETVVLNLSDGKKRRLHNVLVGCSTSSQGSILHAADGVLGMGSDRYSFASKAAEEFDGKFSYCLVDHLSSSNVTSFLTFGGTTTSDTDLNMHYTDLVLGVLGTYYFVDVKGVSVGGVRLNVPAAVWDFRNLGGTIIDSGSSLTFLAVPAYKAVMAALTRPLSGFERVEMDEGERLEFCFNSTAFDEASMPRLAFHFSMGAQFKPPVKNYVIEAKEGVRCLGFVSSPWPGTSMIGNIMQQNYLWEFDLKRGLLGYSASHCT